MKRRLVLIDEPEGKEERKIRHHTAPIPYRDCDNNPDPDSNMRPSKKIRRTSTSSSPQQQQQQQQQGGDQQRQEEYMVPKSSSTTSLSSSTSYSTMENSPPPSPPPSTGTNESNSRSIQSLQGMVRHLRSQHKFKEARKIMEEQLIPLQQQQQQQQSSSGMGGSRGHAGRRDLMQSLTELGRLCFHDNDMDSSMSYHNAALNMYLDKQNDISFAKLAIINLRNVAAIYLRFGKCRESLLCYTFVYRIQQTTMKMVMMNDNPTTTTTTTTTTSNPTNNKNKKKKDNADSDEEDEIATTLSCIGLMHYLLGEYGDALRYYKEELLLRIEHHKGDMEHEDIAIALNSIGIVYYRLDDITAAKQSFQSCLQIRQRLLLVDNTNDDDDDDGSDGSDKNKKNHAYCFDLAMVYFNLAAIAMKQGDDKEASRLYRRSMELKKAVFGNHPEIAVDYQYLGQLFLDQGDAKAAIEYYTEAYKIVQVLSSSNQPQQEQRMSSSSSSGGTTREQQDGQSQAAVLAAQKLLVIIGNIHLLEANIEGMMENFEKAARMVMGGQSNNNNNITTTTTSSSVVVDDDDDDDDDDGSTTRNATTSSFMDNVRVFGGCQLYSISRMHPPCAAEA